MNHLKLFESFSEIDAICKEYGIQNYTINSDGLVDVDGDVFLVPRLTIRNYKKLLTKLPLKFGHVTGDFDCSHNRLTSLEGTPHSIGGDFDCGSNQLTSLAGSPSKVGGDFYCHGNQLTSLVGAPQVVVNTFNCYNNKLTSLFGGPVEVGGDFYCQNNNLTSLECAPQIIGGDFYCDHNPIDSIYHLFTSYSDFLSSMDYNYLRGTNIIKSRFEEMCQEYNINVTEETLNLIFKKSGYNYI